MTNQTENSASTLTELNRSNEFDHQITSTFGMLCTYSDISFSVCVLSKILSAPTNGHLRALRRLPNHFKQQISWIWIFDLRRRCQRCASWFKLDLIFGNRFHCRISGIFWWKLGTLEERKAYRCSLIIGWSKNYCCYWNWTRNIVHKRCWISEVVQGQLISDFHRWYWQ